MLSFEPGTLRPALETSIADRPVIKPELTKLEPTSRQIGISDIASIDGWSATQAEEVGRPEATLAPRSQRLAPNHRPHRPASCSGLEAALRKHVAEHAAIALA
jgi:hypothetical protein